MTLDHWARGASPRGKSPCAIDASCWGNNVERPLPMLEPTNHHRNCGGGHIKKCSVLASWSILGCGEFSIVSMIFYGSFRCIYAQVEIDSRRAFRDARTRIIPVRVG